MNIANLTVLCLRAHGVLIYNINYFHCSLWFLHFFNQIRLGNCHESFNSIRRFLLFHLLLQVKVILKDVRLQGVVNLLNFLFVFERFLLQFVHNTLYK